MLDKLFTSGIRVDILSLLFNNPDEQFYIREIAKLLRKNPSGVKRELDKLEKMGLVVSEREGNLRYFKVVKDSPLFPELKGLIAKSLGLPGALKAMLKASGVKTAFIHGSYVNDEDAEEIEVFIVGGPDINKGIRELERRFDKKISYTQMDEEEYKLKKKKKDARLMRLLGINRVFLFGKI